MFPTSAQIDQLRSGLQGDLLFFLPELVVCCGIVFLLVCRLVKSFDRSNLGVLSAAVVGLALLAVVYQFVDASGWLEERTSFSVEYFAGMLVSDPFAGFVRGLVLSAALLTAILTLLTGIPDGDDSADFHVLLLGGTLGMMLMASVNHLLMVFIAVEMASVPSYALAGFLKGKRTGSESALKYVVFGAGASGVMLYGISLLAGTFGTGHLPNVASAIATRLAEANGVDPLVWTGLALVFVGLGFKLAAVPFHFWCPDVFEGAAAEVAGFLSVASKTAAIALTLRLLQTLQVGAMNMIPPPDAAFVLPSTIGVAVGVFGAITVTFGNLAAFSQSNLKRMLAYSTIAHAGYMLLGVAAVSIAATSAVLYYLLAYLLMNIGAFAVVAFVRNKTGSEELSAFRGLASRSPVLAVTMSLFLFSLLGFPPLAGFAGKFQVFSAVYDAGKNSAAAGHATLGAAFYVLLAVGAVNTALSAYYYLRIVRAMIFEDAEAGAPACSVCPTSAAYVAVLAALLIAAGIIWNPITTVAEKAAASFAPMKTAPITGTRFEGKPNPPKGNPGKGGDKKGPPK
jgi:NADH-quinone oxidoreductase subunit N